MTEQQQAPRRIQRRRTKGWRMPDGAVYVGRPSRWGNPYRVGDMYLMSALLPFPVPTARASHFGRFWSASVTRTIERVQHVEVTRTVEVDREVPVVRTVIEYRDRETTTFQAWTPEEQDETDVYRLYDAAESLVYVGVGWDALDRWRSHARAKGWWGEVKRAETLRYPFRLQALAVEQAVIEHQKPRHNTAPGGLRDAWCTAGWNQPKRRHLALPPARPTLTVQRPMAVPEEPADA